MSMTRPSHWRYRLVIIGLWVSALFAEAQVAVYLKGIDEPKRGDTLRYVASSKNYILIVGGVQLALPFESVERVEIPKPAAMIEAEKMVTDGRLTSAIPILEELAVDFAVLQWGPKAEALLADAYAKAGHHAKALTTYSELFKKTPAGDVPFQTRQNYWAAMLGGQRLDALVVELLNAVDHGPRVEAAHAQVMLGDVRRAQNKTQDAFLEYLRASLLFEDVGDVQPEALFKAAEMLDVLRDPRAGDLRKRVVQKYPASEYARKVGVSM